MQHENTEAQHLNMDVHVGVSALAAFLNGDFQNAIRDCEIGISDASTASQLRDALVLMKGCAHAMQSDFQNAEHHLSAWLAHTEGDVALGYEFRADIYAGTGDWNRALEDLDHAVDCSPETPLLHFQRGAVQAELGQLEAAIQDYETGLRLNPEHPTALLHLMLLKQGSTSALEIAALLRQKEREVSDPVAQPEPTLQTALDRLVASDIQGTLEICEWLNANRPEEVNTVFVSGLAKDLRGRRFSEDGNTASAKQDYLSAIEDFSILLDNHPDSHFATLAFERRAMIRLAIGTQEAITEAIEDFSHVITRDPENPIVYFNRGQSFLARYDYEKANQDFNRVFDFNPDNTLASLACEYNGTVALLNARPADAVELFNEARNYCESLQTEMRLMLFQAAGEYLQAHYEQALLLLSEIESRISILQGRERYEFDRKLEILQTELRPKIETSKVPEDRFLARVKADCDAILKRLYDLFLPETPVFVSA